MGQITDRAEELAAALSSEDYRATCDVRDTVPPCLLVVPVPRRDYIGQALAGSVELEWTFVALGRPPADLVSARDLEDLVDHVLEVLPDIESAEPASYQIPGAESSVPAYQIVYRETATEE